MTIRQKLNLNMVLTAVGILVIAGFSLSGMKYVQGKLNILTEHSTPYQLKTIALQRTLQEHTANLIKLSGAHTVAEWTELKGESERTLAEVQKLAKEVAALKGDTSTGKQFQALEDVTGEVSGTIEERIKAAEAGRAADKVMNQKLQQISANLGRMGTTMKATQKKSVGELSSSNDSVKRSSVKINLTQGVIAALNDLRLALLEIVAADQKSALEVCQAKLATATQAISKSLFMRAEKNTPLGKELTAGLAELNKLATGPGGLVELKMSTLGGGDEAVRRKLSQESAATLQKVGKLAALVTDFAAKTVEASKEEGKKFDKSLEESVILSEHLASNSDLVELCADIRAVIKEMFVAQSEADLARLKERATALFNHAQQLGQGKMKSIEGVGGVLGSLAEVRTALFTAGGVYDRLHDIHYVNGMVEEQNRKLREIVTEQRKKGEAGITSAKQDQEEAVKAVNGVFRSSITGVMAIGAAVLVIGILFSRLVGRSITRPIHELSKVAEGFGNGDFACKLDEKRKDEFGILAGHFNTAGAKLREIVSDLSTAIHLLADNSKQLNGIATRLTNGSHEQATQAVQSAAALEEMTQTIAAVAQNAGQAADATKDASSVAMSGKETVAATLAGMEKIAVAVENSATMIQRLGESSDEIGKIIDVINGIADQTTLLALNAAIEAARAGELGLGFAVVADEVRNLAQRTGEATKEITAMVKEIQQGTNRSVATMHEGKQLMMEEMELTTRAREALEAIVAASDKGAAMVRLIAGASEQQAVVATQVTSGVDRIAQLSKAADADSTTISTSAKELDRIATELDRKAQWFKI
jgi:methyl-accepting chemotaxis protein